MRYLLVVTILGAVACGGTTSSPPEGPLALGVVSGDNQIAPAGSTRLTEPVVGRLVRLSTASGPRFEFVKTAYAQTVVTGSPVVGAVVCAVSVTTGTMVPFVPCTNTDANGTATFFFAPGTKAGEAMSEIRGTLAGQPAVFDTAKATILPGPANPNYLSSTSAYLQSPAVVDPTAVQDQYGNGVPFRIISDGRIGVLGAVAGTAEARTVTFDASLYDNAQNHIVELRDATDAVVGHLRYTVVEGSARQPVFNWISAGVNVSP